jgi:hypothetical protein
MDPLIYGNWLLTVGFRRPAMVNGWRDSPLRFLLPHFSIFVGSCDLRRMSFLGGANMHPRFPMNFGQVKEVIPSGSPVFRNMKMTMNFFLQTVKLDASFCAKLKGWSRKLNSGQKSIIQCDYGHWILDAIQDNKFFAGLMSQELFEKKYFKAMSNLVTALKYKVWKKLRQPKYQLRIVDSRDREKRTISIGGKGFCDDNCKIIGIKRQRRDIEETGEDEADDDKTATTIMLYYPGRNYSNQYLVVINKEESLAPFVRQVDWRKIQQYIGAKRPGKKVASTTRQAAKFVDFGFTSSMCTSRAGSTNGVSMPLLKLGSADVSVADCFVTLSNILRSVNVPWLVDSGLEPFEEATTITAESLAEHQMEQQLANMANSTHQNTQMLEQMTALASTISTLQAQVNSNQSHGRSSGGGGGRGGGRGRSNGRGRGAGPRSPPRYCWTHGNCAHGSAECSTKAAGHIDDATYTNMHGGSVNRCHWLT